MDNTPHHRVHNRNSSTKTKLSKSTMLLRYSMVFFKKERKRKKNAPYLPVLPLVCSPCKSVRSQTYFFLQFCCYSFLVPLYITLSLSIFWPEGPSANHNISQSFSSLSFCCLQSPPHFLAFPPTSCTKALQQEIRDRFRVLRSPGGLHCRTELTLPSVSASHDVPSFSMQIWISLSVTSAVDNCGVNQLSTSLELKKKGKFFPNFREYRQAY